VTSSVLSYTLHAVMLRLSRSVSRQMRHDVFWKLTQLPVGYFDRNQTGEIISHISYDIDTINASLSNDLLQICVSAVTIVGSLVMMVKISPLLILVFCVTVPMSISAESWNTLSMQESTRETLRWSFHHSLSPKPN
jgi:ATP-binding cassette subfamily B protein